MEYVKTIVFDFDNTIAMHQGRDWENAKPNVELIKKLNNLHDLGYRIVILTSRGSLSCNTLEQRIVNNYSQIESWLNKHDVKYDELSFAKPYAEYYIDDKALTPEAFIDKVF